MTENIKSNTISEAPDDKVIIHLLIHIKFAVIVVYPILPFINTPHYISLVLCQTKVIYYQYNLEASV